MCLINCIVITPTKSNYLLFNCININISINGHVLDNPRIVKYFGVLIDDKLDWKHHVSYVSSLCSQRIGIFKKFCHTCLKTLFCCIIMHLFALLFHTVLYFGLTTVLVNIN